MRTSLRWSVLLCLTAASIPAAAQVWDNSGNQMLSGSYYFREVAWLVGNAGDIVRGISASGTLTFDGQGRYSVAGAIRDTAQGSASFSTTGTYSIAANGFGFLSHPLANTAKLYGLVSDGIFIASATDSGFNDLLMAAKVSGATNASFQGSYSLSYLNYPTGFFEDNYSALATLNPNGQGAIGTVAVRGYIAASGTTPFTQNLPGVTYSFTQGAAVVNFPATSQAAIGGQQLLVISADGNFIFGGSPGGLDFFVGVRRSTTTPPPLAGLYYLAGVNQTAVDLTKGADTDTYYGAFQAAGGTIIGHQRFLSLLRDGAQNYTYTDSYPADPALEYTNDVTQTDYVIGPQARFRIGFGRGPFLGLSVAVRAPEFSGEGVYLSPVGVLNGASSAPFTAGVARGELLTLYGSNLANDDLLVAPSLPLPTSLGGVQVMINNRPAPIYYVTKTQVAAVVPYGTSEAIAQVQVINNGTASNAVTAYVYPSAPGVFTVPSGGTGYGTVRHADYSLVDTEHPAMPGEALLVFLTGLGDVFPTIQDGAAGPVSPLSNADGVSAYVDQQPAEILYAGLAPGSAALYQVNLRVPETGVRAGDVYLDLGGAGALTSQALLPVAAAAAEAPARGAGTLPHRRR